MIITAILSRLLTPDDFVIVAIATVIISFFGVISDFGIAPAIVQNKELKDSDINRKLNHIVLLFPSTIRIKLMIKERI